MRFEEACEGWTARRLSQEESAQLLRDMCAHVLALYRSLRGVGSEGIAGQAFGPGIASLGTDG